MPLFLAGRALQGFGGGLLLAFAYAMIRLVFEESLWPRAIALLSGMWGAATLVGPAIGGVFAELGAWRAAFWVLIPISLLFALLAAAVLPKGGPGRDAPTPLPFAQLLWLMAGVFALSAGSVADKPIWTVAGVGGGIVFLTLLAWTERRSASRLFPADALRPSRRLFALYATIALLELSVTSGEVFIPLFLQVLHGQVPLVAGYIGALMGVGWTIGSLLSSAAVGRSVSRYVVIGPILALAGMAALVILVPPPADGLAVVGSICAALLLIGFGVGVGWPHLLTGVLESRRPGRARPGLGIDDDGAAPRHRHGCGARRPGRQPRRPRPSRRRQRHVECGPVSLCRLRPDACPGDLDGATKPARLAIDPKVRTASEWAVIGPVRIGRVGIFLDRPDLPVPHDEEPVIRIVIGPAILEPAIAFPFPRQRARLR